MSSTVSCHTFLIEMYSVLVKGRVQDVNINLQMTVLSVTIQGKDVPRLTQRLFISL